MTRALILAMALAMVASGCKRWQRSSNGADAGPEPLASARPIAADLAPLEKLDKAENGEKGVVTIEPLGPVLCRYQLDRKPSTDLLALTSAPRDHDAIVEVVSGKIKVFAGTWGALAEVDTGQMVVRGFVSGWNIHPTKPITVGSILTTSAETSVSFSDTEPDKASGHVTIALSIPGVSLERIPPIQINCGDVSLEPSRFDVAALLGIKPSDKAVTFRESKTDVLMTIDPQPTKAEADASLNHEHLKHGAVYVRETKGDRTRISWVQKEGAATGWVPTSALDLNTAPDTGALALGGRSSAVGGPHKTPLLFAGSLYVADSDLSTCTATTPNTLSCTKDVRLSIDHKRNLYLFGLAHPGTPIPIRARGLAAIGPFTDQ